MKEKGYFRKYWIAIGITMLVGLSALIFCFTLIQNISKEMRESATSNLLNTTKVIERTLAKHIEKDFESLHIIGEIYKNDAEFLAAGMHALQETMSIEWIGISDREGNVTDSYNTGLQIEDIPGISGWMQGAKGYSDAYFGDSGRLQTTLWTPIYEEDTYIGTIFGTVILSKYYSGDVFTFYEGAGRTYLIDGSNGSWILRSMGADGTLQYTEDIYALLMNSDNQQADVDAFQQAIEQKQVGTAVFNFNEETSYVCFMPLVMSEDWYVITVIANDVLLKESAHVKQMIQFIFLIICCTIAFVAIALAFWQIKRAKVKEADEREKLFANISANIDSAFLIYDKASQKTVFVSENVKRLLGLAREQLKTDAGYLFDWCSISKSDTQRIAFLNGTLTTPDIKEVWIKDELGYPTRCIRLELIPADLGQEIIVLSDITKDKDIQTSLMDAMKQVETASKAKNDFLSAISHDIRTPMNGIVGMTTIAQANLHKPKKVEDCLTKILEASQHLLLLVNEVLDMSQMESGEMELAHNQFNLAEALQTVIDMNYQGILKYHHDVNVRIYAMEHEHVIGDELRLQRIITNLLSNAIKYTPEHGLITLTLKEKASKIKGYGYYELMVKDNGIGMSKAFLERLYEPFEREEDVRTSRIQGTGLGMAIVKNMVSLMMGDIHVETEKGEGTTFWVRFYLQHDYQIEKEEVPVTLPILVYNEDMEAADVLVDMLQAIGMEAERANHMEDAIEKMKQREQIEQPYAALIYVENLLTSNSLDHVAQFHKQIQKQGTLIIYAAYDWQNIEESARDAGVDAFISKPIYKQKLQECLQDLQASITMKKKEVQIHDMQIPKGKKVLLAEDNDLNIEIAKELLHMLSIEVECAKNGKIAVEMFANNAAGTYDAILMDIQMPLMNGYEAAKAIRSMQREDAASIPIIAMTADAFHKDIQATFAAGMNEHIAKPISIKIFTEVLARYLHAENGHMQEAEK